MTTGRKWLLRSFLLVLALLLVVSPVAAQDWRFQVNERLVHVYVNDDGSVWIDYNITFTPDVGAHVLDIVDVGLPNSDYNLAEVKADVGGVEIRDIRHSEQVSSGVEIHMGKFAIQPGSTGKIHVLARVRNMVFQDTDPEYASLRFIPHWYDSANAHGTMHLEIIIHFPEGVTGEEARYLAQFSDAAMVDNRVTYAWIYNEASPSRRYEVGISFPKKYLKSSLPLKVTPEPTTPPVAGGRDLTDILCSGPVCIILGLGVFILFIVLGARSSKTRKMKYLPPVVGVEGAGIKRGLTAVEAALLLEAPLNKVLTMILFGLMKKGVVKVLSENPLRLQANAPVPEDLRDYEKDFVAAVSSDNQLNEKQLRQVMVGLIKTVNEKIKGFSRKDSIAYYKDLVSRAWQQVEGADTPEVKSQRLDDGFEWTMLDEDWNKRVGRTFGDGPVFLPRWWWSYPSTSPTPATPSQSAQPVGTPRTAPSSSGGKGITLPTLPGAAFANTLVTGVEGFSNRMVSSLERFTGSISSITNPPPPPPKTSGSRWSGGGRSGGCACACACAGCACACAGGGR